MRVTIGMPYYDTVMPETVGSLFSAVVSTPEAWHFVMVGGPQIAQNREAIVSEAYANESERLVFVDSDVAFGPDALARLLARPEPIIGGMYHLKQVPLVSAVKLPSQDGDGFFTGRMTMPDHPIKAALLPAGFLSLHLPSLKQLPRPWFANGLERGEIVTEDVTFCRAAQAAGFDLWCDPTLQLKHIGRFAY